MSNTSAKARLAGANTLDDGGEPAIHDLTDFHVTYFKATDDALPADATPDTLIWMNPYSFPVQVVSGRYVPTSGDIVFNATNFFSFSIKTDDGLPGGAIPIATLFYSNGLAANATLQNDSKPFTGWQPTNSIVPPGGGVYYAVNKGGTGAVFRAGLISLRLRRL